MTISGRAWINRDDIARFFESQSTEECKTAERKYQHATNMVTKRRKTSTTLREEESRLTHQISEAQQKVEKFQKHLQDLAFDAGVESGAESEAE
ncbi:hypothetical protein L873DRAFT_1817845, partial [Choiromyces venosus 120613-1]